MRFSIVMMTPFILLAGQTTAVCGGERPNIVFVLFDDMGWAQPQCYDPNSALRTPHLDRLASQGMRFTDAHTAAAVCTPTRYGLLTGRYPSRIGQFGVLTTYSKPIIPADRMTVASFLQRQGYATACVGKWHLGLNWADGKPGDEKKVPLGSVCHDGPIAIGFDYFCGFTHARNIGTIIEQDRVVAHVSESENQPLMIRKALDWLDQQSDDRPFFLYFPMCPPHTPIAPSPEFIGRSQARDVVKQDPQYGDWVFQGDAMLGQIMDKLDQKGLAENTLLIATSDNGAEGRPYAPLRESKRSIYEGGHRVPFVARWPGHTKPGSVSENVVCLNDLMATAANILDKPLPADAAEDSVSFLAALRGDSSQQTREATVHQSSKGDLAIRQGAWKAIFHKDGRRELYNLSDDLSETKDVLHQHPEVATKLTSLLQRYIADGRSTSGDIQQNGFPLTLPDSSTDNNPPKKRKKKNSTI